MIQSVRAMRVSFIAAAALAFLLCAPFAFAQSDVVVDPTIEEAELSVDIEIDPDTGEAINISMDDLEIEEPTSVPSQFGLLWKGFREQLSLLTTFDPVKKAEKQLVFAEERQRLAEFILVNSEDENMRARAEQLIAGSQKLFEKIEERKDKWVGLEGERVAKLVRNIGSHQVRRERLFDRLEEELPEERLDRIRELRDRGHERGERLLNAMKNENIPEEIRAHLSQIQERIGAHKEGLKEFQEERRAIVERVRAGDASAQEELRSLNEERRGHVQERREYREGNAEEQLERARGILRAQAAAGDEAAERALEQLNRLAAQASERAANREERNEAFREREESRRGRRQENRNQSILHKKKKALP